MLDRRTNVPEVGIRIIVAYLNIFYNTWFLPCNNNYDNRMDDSAKGLRLGLDGVICLADSFEFTIYHCTRLKAFRYE